MEPWDDHSLSLGMIRLQNFVFSRKSRQYVRLNRPTNRYEDESPQRNTGKQQRSAGGGGGQGYGEYDYLYKNAPVG